MTDEILVSVVSNVFNQEQYIRDTLEGFVLQKTDFPFEVLIHDDCSTDGTPEIIREYARKYPDLIKPVFERKNQYSQGVYIENAFQYPRAQGEFIAECEGDDYWTDPYKLQKQVDAMRAHPEVDISAHAAKVEINGEIKETFAPEHTGDIIPVEDVIRGGGGFVPTCSLMYRAELIRDIPEFHLNSGLDYSIQILGSLRGGMLFLDDCMAVYRYMSQGSWTESMHGNREKKIKNADRMLRMLTELDAYTEGRYKEVIRETQMKLEFDKLCITGDIDKMKQPPYDVLYENMPKDEKRRIWEDRYLPCLVKLKRKILSWTRK